MKTLLIFLYFLPFLGVFGQPSSSFKWLYSFNVSEAITTQRANFVGAASMGYYPSLNIQIWEVYQNNSEGANMTHRITYTSPTIPPTYLVPWDNGNTLDDDLIYYWYTNYGAHTKYNLEPCGSGLISPPHLINVTLEEEIKLYTRNHTTPMLVNGILNIQLEDTLIPGLPYISNDNFAFHDNYIFKTVRIPPPFENKDLRITFSGSYHFKFNLGPDVILATGNQCIFTYDDSNHEDRLIFPIPPELETWNITVPARDIWFFAIKSEYLPYTTATLTMKWELVDRITL